jgi:hypothetical protein
VMYFFIPASASAPAGSSIARVSSKPFYAAAITSQLSVISAPHRS